MTLRRLFPIIGNLLLALGAILFALLLCEVALRIFKPVFVRPIAKHAEIINYRSAEKQPGFRNSEGLRDSEYPFDHTSYRILALGDSFTEGYHLTLASSWPKQLQQDLRERGYQSVEVLNAGRSGTDTAWQASFLQKHGLKYKPDAVVLSFLYNDCTHTCSNCGAVQIEKREKKAEEQLNKSAWSELQKFVELALMRSSLTQATVSEYLTPFSEHDAGYQQCTDALLRMKRLADEGHFKLLVFIYPMLFDLKHAPFRDIHTTMMDFLRQHDITAFDALPALSTYRDTDLWVLPSDSHPDRQANGIVASALSDFMTTNVLPPLPSR
jgi:hypothetical protein